MKKLILLSITLLMLLACETGVKNESTSNKPVMSGIVERTYMPSTNKSNKSSAKKIFSKSAQPGFYLQMAVFEKHRPNKNFLKPLDSSPFNYIVLNKYNTDYVLIGPYKSYNGARTKVASVKSRLKKQTFVVQVLRP